MPCDFFYKNLAKEDAYRSKARALLELNTTSSSAFAFVSQDLSRKSIDSVPSKLQQCVK
jgi:hypothetical protein